MRLFEAIVEANHRALAGDEAAGIRPHEFAASLPVLVLTCFDPRLHPLMPEVLGIAEPDFIWLTNAGNVVTGPASSTVRSIALACRLHQAREIAVIGHTDCLLFNPAAVMRATNGEESSVRRLLDSFLHSLADERGNVRSAVDSIRCSGLVPADVPVHGLIVETDTGRLEMLVDGYRALEVTQMPLPPARGDRVTGLERPLPPIGSLG